MFDFVSRFFGMVAEAVACLPAGMGLISGVGGIFTRAWLLLGYERFCLALIDEPELVAELFRRIAAIQGRTFASSRSIQCDLPSKILP